MAKISQIDNYTANFGICPRSSAIFWVPPDSQFDVHFVLSNYWMFKNGIEVLLIVSYRDMSGNLIQRNKCDFGKSNVLTLSPKLDYEMMRGGSVEFEALASQDIRIPYAAIMAIYETESSISMVHSYSRAYSSWEIEEKRMISVGHEGCWTLRDTDDIYSFAVMHNGSSPQPSQGVKIEVKNALGEVCSKQICIPRLNAYQTIMVKPSDHISDLGSFLGGQPGSATIDFNLNGGFTRLLLGWHSLSTNQLQVTHSNFNYTIHETDLINDDVAPFAYMKVPNLPFQCNTVVYPEFSSGHYQVLITDDTNSTEETFTLPSTRVSINGSDFKFSRLDGALPSRIVTALERVSTSNDSLLPCECSLGVMHSKRPPKRFHWGVGHIHFTSQLLIVAYPEIYGDPDDTCTLEIKCMLGSGSTLSRVIRWCDIELSQRASLSLKELFPDLEGHLRHGGSKSLDFCYLTIYSPYGGFQMYTAILKQGVWTIEHTF